MENAISINELMKLTTSDIKKLESQQAGLHDIIEEQKERLKVLDSKLKTGNFAEDLLGEI